MRRGGSSRYAMRNKTATHRDINERPIIEALLKVGATVEQLHARNVPDLIVGYRGVTYLLEVKNPADKGELTKAQADWHATWRGRPPVVVFTAVEALRAIGALREPEPKPFDSADYPGAP